MPSSFALQQRPISCGNGDGDAVILLVACGLAAVSSDVSFIILGVLVMALYHLLPIKTGELAMTTGGEKRGAAPGRRSKDFELWALAKDADRKAEEALLIAKHHITVCEEQNRQIIAKLETHDRWRDVDLAFQRKLMMMGIAIAISAIGSLIMFIGQMILRSISP